MAGGKIDLVPDENMMDKSPEQMRESIAQDVKSRLQSEKPGANVEISFSSQSVSDILDKRVDPNEATGYPTFKSEEDYTNWLTSQMSTF